MNTQHTGGSPDPNLALLLNPEDEAHFVTVCETATGDQAGVGSHAKQPSFLYVVVHRRYGAWTHLYRVASDGRPGRLLVYLEMIFLGERLAEAKDWARRNLLPPIDLS
ncbi:hypothetical protein [Mesorhizobium escarrei]|uniref:hypothetical protein n=1 Tax=Mesorhizobium escarrei TaxID=666018 RepID=UPI0020A7271D|nr:hypothetical protein [Mesorhizobium escarrei]